MQYTAMSTLDGTYGLATMLMMPPLARRGRVWTGRLIPRSRLQVARTASSAPESRFSEVAVLLPLPAPPLPCADPEPPEADPRKAREATAWACQWTDRMMTLASKLRLPSGDDT